MAIPFLIGAAARIAGKGAARKFASNFAKDAARGQFLGGGRAEAGSPKNLRLELDMGSYKMTLMALERDTKQLKVAARAGMKAAAVVLMENTRRNMSSTAHSKQDLDRLDNPYAARHGTIRSTSLGGMKPYEVHDQSGTMLRALKVRNRGNKFSGYSEVYIDESIAPHAKYVLSGTRVLKGRNVINETLQEQEVIKEMKSAMVNAIRKRGPKGQFGKMDVRWTFG
jgi:hypothetical protein